MLCTFSDLGEECCPFSWKCLDPSWGNKEDPGPWCLESRRCSVLGCARLLLSLSPLKSMTGRGWTMMTHPAPAPAQQTGERRKNRFDFDSKLAISDETGGWQHTSHGRDQWQCHGELWRGVIIPTVSSSGKENNTAVSFSVNLKIRLMSMIARLLRVKKIVIWN